MVVMIDWKEGIVRGKRWNPMWRMLLSGQLIGISDLCLIYSCCKSSSLGYWLAIIGVVRHLHFVK